jgi:O-antigen/teichoic acid export membrane protein
VQAKPEHVSSRIIGNVLMNWVAFAISLLAGFLMSPFLVRHLGDSVYGVWVLIGSLAGYLGLLDFGVTPSIIKYIAENRARGDRQATNRVVTGGLAVFSLVGIVSLIVSAVIALSFNRIFNTPLGTGTAAAAVMITGLNLSLTFPATVFVGVIRGHQRYDIDALITSINIAVRSLIIVYLLSRGYGILALAAVTFIFDMIRLLYLIWWAFKLDPDITISRAFLDKAELLRLFKFGSLAFVILAGRQLMFYTDSIVIGVFLSTSAVTVYFIANRLVLYLRMLVAEMVGVLMPTTSDMGARDDQAGIKELLVISTKYMLLIALPVASVFFIMGSDFIALWMGPGYSAAVPVLTVLTVAMLAHFMEMPGHTILLGLNKHKIVALFTVPQALVNLGLSVLLVRRLGIMGVALGTAIPMVAFTMVALVVYCRTYIKVSLGDYLKRSGLLPLLIQAPFISSLLILRNSLPPASLLAFFLEIAAALIPYSAIAFFVCISPSERRAFLRTAERFGLKLSPRFS